MARPVEFAEANLTLWPAGAAADGAVPVRVLDKDGCRVSCYAFSLEELGEVVRTGVCWAAVKMVDGQPYLQITGHKAVAL